MRPRTVAAVGAVVLLLAGVVAFGLAVSPAGGDLRELWVSDTPRDNEVNHHAVGVGPDENVIVAPVAEVPYSDAEISNTSCALVRLAPGDGATLWEAGMPADACFTHALTEPAIADVDGDGALEVAVSTTENALVVSDAATGTEEWRVPLGTYGYGRPTVANVTTAPGPEIVTSDIEGGVVVAHGNGSVVWRTDLNETAWSRPTVWKAPVVADVDGDGRTEILLGSNRGLALLMAEGTVEWRRNGSAAYIAEAQADEDTALELFTASSSLIRAFDGATGAAEWERTDAGGRIGAAADADGDGTVELFVGRVGGEVLALDARTGETEWSTTVSKESRTIVPPPVLGDVDGDGRPEVVTVTNDGVVAVLGPESGAELARYERNVRVWTFATSADVDDDGRDEVLVRYGDGRVVALEYES